MVQVGKLKDIEPPFETALEKPRLVRRELWPLQVVQLKVLSQLKLLRSLPKNEVAVELLALGEENKVQDGNAQRTLQKVSGFLGPRHGLDPEGPKAHSEGTIRRRKKKRADPPHFAPPQTPHFPPPKKKALPEQSDKAQRNDSHNTPPQSASPRAPGKASSRQPPPATPWIAVWLPLDDIHP